VGLPGIDFLQANRMPLRFAIGGESGCAVLGDAARLPLASQSVDLLVLPHILEFCADPHQVLREAERVLMPEGRIVISGFNPLSLWGAARFIGAHRQTFPWRGDFVGLMRLRDWLKLLGFDLDGGKFGCYAPPMRQARWLQRFRVLELAGERWWPIAGGVYVIRAVKRVVGTRIVTPNWRRDRRQVHAVATVARRERSSAALRVIQGNPLTPPMGPGVAGRALAVKERPRRDER
jgi:SAM-dependent methyltransferase